MYCKVPVNCKTSLTNGLLFVMLALAGPAQAQMSNEQEINLGREASLKFEAKYGVSSDIQLQERLNRIGHSLVPHCGRTDIPYSFKVVNMKEFNALAFPGGFIYATSGLMQSLDDQQLAFVIGHELTHVSHRHAVKQMNSDQMRQMGLLAALVALSGGRPTNAQAQVAGLVDKVVSSQYSQADEADADSNGIQTMAAAGIDPVHSISALQVLAKQAGGTPGFLNTLVGSHPMPEDRIKDAVVFVPKVPFRPPAPRAPVDRPLTVPSAPGPAPVRTQGQLDHEWTSVLQRDAQLSGLNLAYEASFSGQLTNGLARGNKFPPQRTIRLAVPAGTSLSAYEQTFVGRDLAANQLRGKRVGVAVWLNGDGSRTIYLLTN